MVSRLLAATLIGLLSTTALAASRRRAVSRPRPPTHILQHVIGHDDVRYTNHTNQHTTVRACLEGTSTCLTDVLAPGASVTKHDLVRILGRNAAHLELHASGDVEIRARNDAIPTSVMTVERQTVPHMVAGQTLQVYSWSRGSAELVTRANNGVQKHVTTLAVQRGTTTIELPGVPGSLGDHYDLLPSVPTIATSTMNGVVHRAKPFTEAVGRQFLVRAKDATVAWAKNTDPTSILALTSIRYSSDATSTFANTFDALNWGTTYLNTLTNGITGSVDVHGLRVNDVEQPFLAWSSTPFQREGATANTRFVTDTRYNLSLNQLPENSSIALFAAQTDAHYTINAYNDQGTRTGTTSGTLLPNQSTEVDVRPLGGTRIEAVVADRTDNVAGHPNLLLSATINGVEKTGYRVEKSQPAEPQYDITTKIYVRDNDTTFIQTTQPTAEVIKKIFGFEPINTLDPLVGLHQYACESLPDPIVNSIPEIVRNYLALTPAEQLAFSGDVEGWKPFLYHSWPSTSTVDPCNEADPDKQFTYLITTEIIRN